MDAATHVAVLLGGTERRAGLHRGGRVHILRHTFCCRRAARNQPMLSIEELPGHESLETTQRCMHLSAAAPREEGTEPITKWPLKWLIDMAERRGALRQGGRVYILRHTFCSRLAAANVPMLTIKELAGHVSLETTQRHMHLSAAAPREAIQALERGTTGATRPGSRYEAEQRREVTT